MSTGKVFVRHNEAVTKFPKFNVLSNIGHWMRHNYHKANTLSYNSVHQFYNVYNIAHFTLLCYAQSKCFLFVSIPLNFDWSDQTRETKIVLHYVQPSLIQQWKQTVIRTFIPVVHLLIGNQYPITDQSQLSEP